MTTNRFGAQCAVCGTTVPPGEGVVHADRGRAVTHADCVPAERASRSFTVRRIDHDVETLLAAAEADDGHDVRMARGLAVAAGAALVLLAVVGAAALRTDGPSSGSTSPGAPVSTTVRTEVAGAVEVRTTTTPPTTVVAAPIPTAVPEPSTTVAPSEPPVTTEAPATTAVRAPVPVTEVPPAPATTEEPPPTTAPPTTLAPTTTTAPPTTTSTTTRPPTTTTTRRGNSGKN